MPIEKRQIILSDDEVLQAITAYRPIRGEFLPAGEVLGITLKPTGQDNGVQLVIAFSLIYGQSKQTVNIEAANADVIELLIRCCLENNIPIPRVSHSPRVSSMVCSRC